MSTMVAMVAVVAVVAGKDIAGIKENIQGVVVPVLTNYFNNTDKDIDHDSIAANVKYVVSRGVVKGNGILLSGASGGDFPDLSTSERKEVAKTIITAADGKVPVLVCVQSTRLPEAIELAKYAESIGAYGIQLSVPYYWTTTDDDALRWFRAVHEATSGVYIFIYNVPWESYDMPLPVIKELAKLPRIAGLKWATYRAPVIYNTHVYLEQLHDDLAIVDNGGAYVDTYLLGGTGFITHLATVWPEQQVALHHMLKRGDYANASRVITETNRKWYGFRLKIGDRTSGESSVVKAALDMLGRPGGVEREPTRDLNEEERAELKALLGEMGVPGLSGSSRSAVPVPVHDVVNSIQYD